MIIRSAQGREVMTMVSKLPAPDKPRTYEFDHTNESASTQGKFAMNSATTLPSHSVAPQTGARPSESRAHPISPLRRVAATAAFAFSLMNFARSGVGSSRSAKCLAGVEKDENTDSTL